MTAIRSGAGALVLLLTALAASGCNILSVPFFLFGPEPSLDAKLKKLASDDRDKTVRVAIVVNDRAMTSDFIGVDRDLTQFVVAKLKEQCKYNKEKVEVVAPAKVLDYKNNHLDVWDTMDLREVGKHFDADYVVDLEITKMSLFEYGSFNQLYRGRAEVSVTLVDVKNEEEGLERTEISHVYPNDSTQGIPIDDKVKQVFRAEFYKSLATQIAWHFTSHPTRDDYREK
jgi:hypothetical protein